MSLSKYTKRLFRRDRLVRWLLYAIAAINLSVIGYHFGFAQEKASAALRPPLAAPRPPVAAPQPRGAEAPTLELAPLVTMPLASASQVSTVGGSWTAQGPGPILNGQTQALPGLNPVDGAIEWTVPHPTNSNILYAATVNGGVWLTSNATATSPTWTPLTDNQASLSMGALKFDPTDATNQTLVAGIGRFSNLAQVGERLTGILRTTNGGTSWTALNGGGVLRGKNIVNVVPRGKTIVVAVDTADSYTLANVGIFRSTDTGTSFKKISGAAGSGLPGGVTFDVVGDPVSNKILYTAVVFAGAKDVIYKSTDTGKTWARVSTATVNAKFNDATTTNIRLAPGKSNNVHVAIGNNDILDGLFRSGDGGATWAALDIPFTTENGTPYGINPGKQVQPNLSIVADPGNPNLVYVGGDRQPSLDENENGSKFPNSIGADNYVGRIFRVDASQPSGSQFFSETNSDTGVPEGWGTASNSAPHADSRSMAFDASGNLIETDDGGIYKRTNPQNSTGDWFSLNGNIQVTELHSTAYDTNAHIIIGGAQDVGAAQQPSTDAVGWSELLQGDGADVDTRATTTAGVWVRYSSYVNLQEPRLRQTYDASNVLQTDQSFALKIISGDAMDPGFNSPVRANAVDASRVLFGCKNGIYESLDQGDSVSQISDSLVVNDQFDHSAMVYGGVADGTNNPDLIIVGAGSELWTRTAPAPAEFTQITTYPGILDINGVAVDPADSSTICTVDDAKIFCSINGEAWADRTGALAGHGPFNTISIGTVNGATSVLVGSDAGVFISALSSIGTWSQVGTGLPNAKVMSIGIDSGANVVMAGTLGRGAWTVSLGADPNPTATPTSTATAVTRPTPTATPTPKVPAAVEISPPFVNFGKVRVGGAKVKVVTLTNTAPKKGDSVDVTFMGGTLSESVTGGSVSEPSAFSGETTCTGKVPPQGKCTVTLSFAPSARGPEDATVTINSNASNSPHVFGVSGTGE